MPDAQDGAYILDDSGLKSYSTDTKMVEKVTKTRVLVKNNRQARQYGKEYFNTSYVNSNFAHKF